MWRFSDPDRREVQVVHSTYLLILSALIGIGMMEANAWPGMASGGVERLTAGSIPGLPAPGVGTSALAATIEDGETSVGSVAQEDPLPVFFDDFEDGTFGPEWQITGTGPYRTRITTEFGPHSGSYHLIMDSTADGGYARNEATLRLDLRGFLGVTLSFWAREYGDECQHPPSTPFSGGADFDGVAVSEDGASWYEIQSFCFLTGTYQKFVIDLDQVTRDLGLRYTQDFRIRFNQYDDYPTDTDGIAIDDVTITAEGGPGALLAFDRAVYACSGTVNILLLDASVAGSATASVIVGTETGDSEELTMTAEGPPLGRFEGSVELAAGSAVIGDGTLQVAPEDILLAAYEYVDERTGNRTIATASAEIDCIAPVISRFAITGIRAVDAFAEVTISEPAKTVVRVGTSCDNLDMEFPVETFRVGHRIHLVGLAPETGYFADVEVEDRPGNRTSFSAGGTCYSFETTGFPQPPFFDDFELPRSETQWFFTGSGDFRTEITTGYGPANGSYHLVMDDAVPESGFSSNEATVILNLEDWENVRLTYWAREYDDEPHGPPPLPFKSGDYTDGVAVSEDGINWYEVQSLRFLTNTYQQYSLFLDPYVDRFGLRYTKAFHIRFNHYDDNPVPSDGIALDDVRITAVPADDLKVIPFDNAVFSGPPRGPFRSTVEGYRLVNEGTGAFEWTAGTGADWLEVSPSDGVLTAGASTEVRINIGTAAKRFPTGVHPAGLRFTNLSTGFSQDRAALLVVTAGGDWGLDFDGDDVAVSDYHPALATGLEDGFTIEYWVLRRGGGGFSQTLLAKDGEYGQQTLSFVSEQNGSITFWVRQGQQTQPGLLPLNTWTHVAGVWDPPKLRIYVNGVLRTESGLGFFDYHDAMSEITLGGSADLSGHFFNGILDEVRVWNTVRSATEIEFFHDRQLTGNEPGLVAAWSLDEGFGQSSWDSGPRGIHLRLGSESTPDTRDPAWVPATKAWIDPALPTSADDLACVLSPGPGGVPLVGDSYRWFLDGAEITEPVEHDGRVFLPDGPVLSRYFTVKNETVYCTVTVFDGISTSSIMSGPVTIRNDPPDPAVIHIRPRNPSVDDGLTAVIDRASTDMDGDAIGYEIRWYVSRDGGDTFVFQPFLSGPPPIALWIPPGYLMEGDIWRVEVLVYEANDPGVRGETAWDEVYVGANQSPTVQIIEPSPDNVIAYPSAAVRWSAEDPDGDPVSVDIYYDEDDIEGEGVLIARDQPAEGVIYWTPPGMGPEFGTPDVDNDGFITSDDLFLFAARWRTEPPDGRYRIFARARDGKGAIGEAFSLGEIIVPHQVPGTNEALLRMMGAWTSPAP